MLRRCFTRKKALASLLLLAPLVLAGIAWLVVTQLAIHCILAANPVAPQFRQSWQARWLDEVTGYRYGSLLVGEELASHIGLEHGDERWLRQVLHLRPFEYIQIASDCDHIVLVMWGDDRARRTTLYLRELLGPQYSLIKGGQPHDHPTPPSSRLVFNIDVKAGDPFRLDMARQVSVEAGQHADVGEPITEGDLLALEGRIVIRDAEQGDPIVWDMFGD